MNLRWLTRIASAPRDNRPDKQHPHTTPEVLVSTVDPSYWPRTISLRVVIALSYFLLIPTGLLPMSRAWWLLSGGGLLAYSVIVLAAYFRWPEALWFHKTGSPYIDTLMVTLATIALGMPSYPIWIGYLIIISTQSAVHTTRYVLLFSLYSIAAYWTGLAVVHTTGQVRLEPQIGVVASIMMMFTAMNSEVISTSNRRLQGMVLRASLTDRLTGLANRARFMDRLEHELARSTRHGRAAAVLFMDLDDFKSVNDRLGHPAGDRMLIDVAARLELSLRPGDTPARFGGDEFAILLEEIDGPEEALDVGGRIIEALRAPFALDGNEVFIRASIGIALSRPGQPSAEELLRRADVAMYAVKGGGKGRCEVYDPCMQASIVERMTLASDLQRAVVRGELVVYYQPVVELETGRIAGVEALVRWQHPERGLLQPAEFISLAEETGLILPLGQWVLGEACRRAQRWQEAYPAEPPLAMAVNVSVGQIYKPGLKDVIAQELRGSGLAPQTLILEITESVMMWDADTAIERLNELKALGVRLAVDDFGTGYSSLSYLRRFPIDVLKIDKSFVDGMGTREREEDLARVIVELGRTLKLEIVAEGIERAEQLIRLRALHCKYGQGYYFAQPLKEEAIDALLSRGGTIRPPVADAA
jgi:diguanylate cyclase (GGDEF)-like protein